MLTVKYIKFETIKRSLPLYF